MMILYFFIGSILASFFACISIRQSIFKSYRSYCDCCKHPLSFVQLIPLLSFIILKGRCTYCNHSISVNHFILEFFGGIILALLYLIPTDLPSLQVYLFFLIIAWLLFLSIYDYVHYEVTWWQIFFLIFLVLTYCYCAPLETSVAFSILFWLCLELIVVVRPDSFGGADAKILGILSLTLPIMFIPYFLLASATVGIIAFSILKNQQALPFIPCITLGYLVSSIILFYW